MCLSARAICGSYVRVNNSHLRTLLNLFRVPLLHQRISIRSRRDGLFTKKNNEQEHAEPAHRQVNNPEIHIQAPEFSRCRKHQRLGRGDVAHKEVSGDIEGNHISLLEVPIQLAVELAEGGQTRRLHPDDEVLVRHAEKGRYLRIGLVQVLHLRLLRVPEAVLQAGGVRVALGAVLAQQRIAVRARGIELGGKARHLQEVRDPVRLPGDTSLIELEICARGSGCIECNHI